LNEKNKEMLDNKKNKPLKNKTQQKALKLLIVFFREGFRLSKPRL